MHRPITVHIKGSTLTRMHTQARTGVHAADGVGLIESIVKSFELSKRALLPHFCGFVGVFGESSQEYKCARVIMESENLSIHVFFPSL